MNLTLTARHGLVVPPTLEEMLRTKAEHLERFGHKLLALHAVFGREKYFYTAELTLAIKGLTLVARASHPKDTLTCLEDALAKLARQLQRHERKERQEKRRRVPHRPA